MQLTLDLSPPAVTPIRFAERARDRALAQCEAKARTVDPVFVERACEHMLRYLDEHGVSSGELLTDACKQAGIVSSNDKHFGVPLQRLLRQGLIRWAGSCRRTKGNLSRGGSVYERVRGG